MKCLKTMSGKHIWNYRYKDASEDVWFLEKYTYVDSDGIIKVPNLPICFACGVIDDTKKTG